MPVFMVDQDDRLDIEDLRQDSFDMTDPPAGDQVAKLLERELAVDLIADQLQPRKDLIYPPVPENRLSRGLNLPT